MSAWSRRNNPKHKKGDCQVSLVDTKTALASQNKALNTANRQIAALCCKVKQKSDSDDPSEDNPEDNAGNLFGGREEKDLKKNKKKS